MPCRAAVDFPRTINVFVVSDATAVGVPLGWAFVPGSDTEPIYGHIYLSYDTVSLSGSNSLAMYNDGATTLWHEAAHHLGCVP